MKRILTRQEVHDQSAALRKLENWEKARAFAQRVYGARAKAVLIEEVFTEPDPTDPGRFSLKTTIEEWSVLDEHSSPIEADLTLDFWDAHLSTIQRALHKGLARPTIGQIICAELNEAVSAEEEKYDLTLAPLLPFPTVYVEEAEPTPLPSRS